LPITALRETPIAVAIWLQVMPVPTQLLSCSIRSGVQVAVEVAFDGAMPFRAGATIAGSTMGAVDATGGSADGESEGDGAIDEAIDGDMTASLYCRDRSGPPTGRLSARSGQPRERETSKRKSVRGLMSRSGKSPRRDPKAGASQSAEKSAAPGNSPHSHRAASRLKDGKPAVGVAPVRCNSIGAASYRC
jgi:hypothetical protein